MTATQLSSELARQIASVLLGKDEAIRLALTALFARGHLLIEDAPGVGKTLLARSLARSLALPFQRLQCTADLLPGDLLGAEIWDPSSGSLRFRKGPVFTAVFLADELNRMPPRTQSALLECMSERQVSIGRKRYRLEEPFFVIATQNPEASSGTYPLPENQLDRFLLRIDIGYPDAVHERLAVKRENGHHDLDALPAIADAAMLLEARAQVEQVTLAEELVDWIVSFAQRTRSEPDFKLGLSTRGAQALHRAARAYAFVCGRDYVIPDDLDRILAPVCAHRITCRIPGQDPRVRLEQLRQETAPTSL